MFYLFRLMNISIIFFAVIAVNILFYQISAETNEPLQEVTKSILQLKKPLKKKVTPQTIAKNVADLCKMYTEEFDHHSFNPADYKRDATRAGGLSKPVKSILKVETEERSEVEIRAVDVSI